MKITIEEMRAEIACEHEKRRKNFTKWVRAGTMTQADADTHNARMEAVLQLLDRSAAK